MTVTKWMEPMGYQDRFLWRSIGKAPWCLSPGFFATNMEKPKVAVSTPSQNSRRKRFRKDFRAGDDGNRAGGEWIFEGEQLQLMMRFSDGGFEDIVILHERRRNCIHFSFEHTTTTTYHCIYGCPVQNSVQ